MIITICDVPEQYKGKITDAGGVVVRHWGSLMDVQFKNYKMRVADDHVRVWQPRTPHEVVFDEPEFSNIYVQ